jgi:hypothetical protein
MLEGTAESVEMEMEMAKRRNERMCARIMNDQGRLWISSLCICPRVRPLISLTRRQWRSAAPVRVHGKTGIVRSTGRTGIRPPFCPPLFIRLGRIGLMLS